MDRGRLDNVYAKSINSDCLSLESMKRLPLIDGSEREASRKPNNKHKTDIGLKYLSS